MKVLILFTAWVIYGMCHIELIGAIQRGECTDPRPLIDLPDWWVGFLVWDKRTTQVSIEEQRLYKACCFEWDRRRSIKAGWERAQLLSVSATEEIGNGSAANDPLQSENK